MKISVASLKKFLLFCAGTNSEILNKIPPENAVTIKHKHAAIGATVLSTSTMAFLSGSYAIYTIFNSLLLSNAIGILWALTIFNLDRFFILNIGKQGDNLFRQVTSALPRLSLAVLLSIVIAKPLELKFFEQEIQEVIHEENLNKEEAKIKNNLKERLNQLEQQITSFQQQQRTQLNRACLSKKSKVNCKELDEINNNFRDKIQKSQDIINNLNQELSLENLTNNAKNNLQKQSINIGLLKQLTTLETLGETEPHIKVVSNFINLLFLILEISPLLAKLLDMGDSYDLTLKNQEQEKITEMKKKIMEQEIEIQQQLSNYKIQINKLKSEKKILLKIEAHRTNSLLQGAAYFYHILLELIKKPDTKELNSQNANQTREAQLNKDIESGGTLNTKNIELIIAHNNAISLSNLPTNGSKPNSANN